MCGASHKLIFEMEHLDLDPLVSPGWLFYFCNNFSLGYIRIEIFRDTNIYSIMTENDQRLNT